MAKNLIKKTYNHRRSAITFVFLSFVLIFLPAKSFAQFTNYNSVMMGERAGGMGGAFTAMTGDSAASPYYNPANLARLEGSSISASANLFNKYDVSYGTQDSLGDAVFRINKGTILSVPAASGIFSCFENFCGGLSILIPDYQRFGGTVASETTDKTFLRLDGESLWIGGSFAMNATDRSGVGVSFYYTSDNYSRSLTNRFDDAGDSVVFHEEKTISTNSFIALLGYFYDLTPNWKLGASYRFRSIPIAGSGSYFQSQVGTISGAQPVIEKNGIDAEISIPEKLSFGVAYELPGKRAFSFDVTYHGSANYADMDVYGDSQKRKGVFNALMGYEQHLVDWLTFRFGLFTDYSATPEIENNPTTRSADHIDKYGFSANFGLQTTEHTSISLGGYYSGGTGYATERIGPNFERINKSERVFSFLVGTSYHF